MARWEPNASERLQKAAYELFHERGYSGTTVQDIAARAGLTERTFFRYFTDKREVLFAGSASLQAFLVEQVAAAPKGARPLDAVVAALEALAPDFQERRAFAHARYTLVAANPEIQERELIKMTTLGSAVADALRARGVAGPAATLAAQAGMAVFHVAFERWVSDARGRDLAHHVRAAVEELRDVTASGAPTPRATRTGRSGR